MRIAFFLPTQPKPVLPGPLCMRRSLYLLSFLFTAAPAASDPLVWHVPPSGYEAAGVEGCPNTARRAPLYRVCDDQMQLYANALASANAKGKLLLVTFGASWCQQCQALNEQMQLPAGQAESLADLGRDFETLSIAVSTTVNNRRLEVPSGRAVLALVLEQARGAKLRSVPFMAVIDPNDATKVFARNLDGLQLAENGGFDPQALRHLLRAGVRQLRTGEAAPTEPGWIKRKLMRWLAI